MYKITSFFISNKMYKITINKDLFQCLLSKKEQLSQTLQAFRNLTIFHGLDKENEFQNIYSNWMPGVISDGPDNKKAERKN